MIPPRGPQRLFYVDGGRRLAGFGGGSLYFFDPKTLRVQKAPPSSWHVVGLRTDRVGKYLLAFCNQPGRVEVWDSHAGKRVVIIPPPPGVSWNGMALAHRADVGGGNVVLAWKDRVGLYQANNGLFLSSRKLSGKCTALAFSPDGSEIAVCVAVSAHGATGSRVEILSVTGGLRVSGMSSLLRGHKRSHIQLKWWGARRLVQCSDRWVAIWGIGGTAAGNARKGDIQRVLRKVRK